MPTSAHETVPDPRPAGGEPVGPAGFSTANWIGLFVVLLVFAAAAAALLRERDGTPRPRADGDDRHAA